MWIPEGSNKHLKRGVPPTPQQRLFSTGAAVLCCKLHPPESSLALRAAVLWHSCVNKWWK